MDWYYDDEKATTAAEWASYRLKSAAAARAKAIELANGSAEINTEVTASMAAPFKKYMHGRIQDSLAGHDCGAGQGVPCRGENDARTWPLIFDGTSVLRVADHDDGYALYGRRGDDSHAYNWVLPPFHEYTVEDCER